MQMTGLTKQQVQERILAGKVNTNASLRTKSVMQIMLENTCTLFNLVNVLLAVCLFLVHSYRNLLFLGVVFSNLFIGIVQELRAKYVMDKLSLLTEAHVFVIRDKEEVEIPMHEIVTDELIHLKPGMQICADAVIEKGECEVNESLLTGESDSIEKAAGDFLMSGSFMVSGDAYAVVKNVGKDSYANQITASAKYMKRVNSEIKSSVMTIIKLVSIAIFPIAALLFWNQIGLSGANLSDAVVNTVAALLGMIPEGLVLLTSIVMAVSVIRLSKKNTLVQQMYCVETLARVDVFCLDKTGTITTGKMCLSGIQSIKEHSFENALAEFMGAMKAGNATFTAIDTVYHSETWKVDRIIPFSSERKYSGVVFGGEHAGTYILGAPEMVLKQEQLYEKIIDGAKGKEKCSMQEIMDVHTAKGERVLVFAYAKEEPQLKQLPEHLEPVALLFIEDVIKEGAPQAIEYLKKQNVQLKIISGDNPKAVSDIARRAGIEQASRYVDCSKMEDEDIFTDMVETVTIFGRVSPHQKQMIIRALKKKHTVAMTGDGVNDVLALKESDCSIAMQAGSEAARNVSDVVLMDSDFASIPDIINEGRRSINNLQRSSSLFLVKTVFAVILAVVFCFFNRNYPYQPIQMSLISGICIGIPSFVLALEHNHDLVTPGFLQKVFRIALPGGILMAANVIVCVILGVLFGFDKADISTLTTYMGALVFALILFRICYPFNLLRTVLYISLVALFAGTVLVAGKIFFITSLGVEGFLIMAVLEAANVIVFPILQQIITELMNLKWFNKITKTAD